jgi:hypothetical protein
LPHAAQVRTNAAPHFPQYRASLGFEAPHAEHSIGHRTERDATAAKLYR